MANEYDIIYRKAGDEVEWSSLEGHPTTVSLSGSIDSNSTDIVSLSGSIDSNSTDITNNLILHNNETEYLSGAIDRVQTLTVESSGTVFTGNPVIMNDNGTVERILKHSDDVYETTNLSPSASTSIKLAYDTKNDRYIAIYLNVNTDTFYSKVGELSGSHDIVWGDEQVVKDGFRATAGHSHDVLYIESRNKIAVVLNGNESYDGTYSHWKGYVVIGEVDPSTNTMTWGTPVPLPTVPATAISDWGKNNLAYHTVEDRLLIAYTYEINNVNAGWYGHGWIIAGNISGNSITLGTSVQYTSTINYDGEIPVIEYDPYEEKILILYNSANDFKLRTCTLSNTTITLSSVEHIMYSNVYFNSIRYWNRFLTYDYESKKFVALLGYRGDTGDCVLKVIDISNDTVTYSNDIDKSFVGGNNGAEALIYDPFSKKIVVGIGNTDVRIGKGTVVGNNIIFDKTVAFLSFNIGYGIDIQNIPDGSGYVVVFDDTNFDLCRTIVQLKNSNTNLNKNNFMGIAQQTTSNNTTLVGIEGYVDKNQSGLISGRNYYIDIDGEFVLDNFNLPFAGQAVSDTEIHIKGYDDTVKEWTLDQIEYLSNAVNTTHTTPQYDNAPTNAKAGQIYWDTTAEMLYCYTNPTSGWMPLL